MHHNRAWGKWGSNSTFFFGCYILWNNSILQHIYSKRKQGYPTPHLTDKRGIPKKPPTTSVVRIHTETRDKTCTVKSGPHTNTLLSRMRSKRCCGHHGGSSLRSSCRPTAWGHHRRLLWRFQHTGCHTWRPCEPLGELCFRNNIRWRTGYRHRHCPGSRSSRHISRRSWHCRPFWWGMCEQQDHHYWFQRISIENSMAGKINEEPGTYVEQPT